MNIGSNTGLFAGGAVVCGLLFSAWRQIKGFFSLASSKIIITANISALQNEAVKLYLKEHFTASKFGPRSYAGHMLYVQPESRVQMVAMETVPKSGKIYWKKWYLPIWVKTEKKDNQNIPYSAEEAQMQLVFLIT